MSLKLFKQQKIKKNGTKATIKVRVLVHSCWYMWYLLLGLSSYLKDIKTHIHVYFLGIKLLSSIIMLTDALDVVYVYYINKER